MSLTLTLHTTPEVPVEAENISPDRLHGLSGANIEKEIIRHGNQQVPLAEFFKVTGGMDGEIIIEGDVAKIKHIGSGMTSGKLRINGNAGAHLGAGMSGGSILVEGSTGDWLGPEISGGRIEVMKNAGHMVGSAYRGSAIGMLGGEIIIHGNAKNETGHGMRNGLIAVGGDSGDFTGVNMLAGTIVVLGNLGIRSGAGMKRGSIISLREAEILPTFSFSCIYQPSFLRLYLQKLKDAGMPVQETHLNGKYARWCGDAVELNRGEILLFQG